jgi:anti-sigma factor RsiW
MNRHEFEPEEIMAYLDGELGANEARSAAAHIEHCVECQAIAGQLWRISDRLLDFRVEPCPKTVDRKVLEMAATRHQGQKEAQPSELRTTPRAVPGWVWAPASIAILLGLASLIIPKRLPTNPAPQQTAASGQAPVVEARPSVLVPPTASTSAARDLNGMFEGSDRALSSFSVNGQAALTDQQAKLPESGNRELRPPMIVSRASLTILASNYDQASGAVERLTTQHGGYVEDITTNTQTGQARSMTATLRVPDKQLEPFLADASKLGHVEQETRKNQEVTGPYLDLAARLRNARAAELRILNLLRTKTGNLGDVLQAEQELARIRSDVESLDGQRATLEHQLRYATVSLRLDEEYRRELNPRAFTTSTRIRNAVVAGLQNVEDSLLALSLFLFAYGLPILFWLALAATPSWFIWRWVRRVKAD